MDTLRFKMIVAIIKDQMPEGDEFFIAVNTPAEGIMLGSNIPPENMLKACEHTLQLVKNKMVDIVP